MNSEEALSRIKKSHRIAMACLGIDKPDIETEKAIKIIEKELKVLEIIKTKNVDIDYIKTCFYDRKGGFKDYNSWVGHDDDEELSQEEYYLLKEVLEDE